MSEENVEVVGRTLRAVNQGDFDTALTSYDREAVWEHNLGIGTLAKGIYFSSQSDALEAASLRE